MYQNLVQKSGKTAKKIGHPAKMPYLIIYMIHLSKTEFFSIRN